MSSVSVPLVAAAHASDPRRRAMVALGRIEARRAMRSPWVVVVALYTAWTAANASGADWSGAAYSLLPLYFVPLGAFASFQGLRAGGRDRHLDRPALAEEAALGEEERVLGRLLGLSVWVVVAAVGVAVVEVGSRIEGGYWMGEGLRSTQSAHHTAIELLQPPAMVAAAGAAGVALGRRFRRRYVVGVGAGFFWFLQWGTWWAFQWVPMIVVTYVVTQPMTTYAGPASSTEADFPESWWVEAPSEPGDVWVRQVVSQPLVAGHVLYLIGLTVLFTSNALRHRGPGVEGGRSPLSRRLRWLGWLTVAAGVVVQLAALGWSLTPGGTGLGQMP